MINSVIILLLLSAACKYYKQFLFIILLIPAIPIIPFIIASQITKEKPNQAMILRILWSLVIFFSLIVSFVMKQNHHL